MEKQTPRIKLASHTKRLLEDLKTEENWSFDRVIQNLLFEHEELNDPDIIEEKEKKHKEEYVERSEYSRLYSENIDNRGKVNELEEKVNDTIKEATKGKKDMEEDFIIKFKEQQRNYDKLQDALALKTDEIEVLTTENRDLKQNIEQLNVNLSVLQEKYDKFTTRYDRLRNYVDNECLITKKQLNTLFHISLFLSRFVNRKCFFTIDQIADKLYSHPSILFVKEDIEDVIPLFDYRIFPIKKYKGKDDKVCYQFDRHYMKQ